MVLGHVAHRRFLRARKFDLPKAKIMWIDTQNWRKSFGVDELYETFEYKEKAEVDKYYPKCAPLGRRDDYDADRRRPADSITRRTR